MRIVFKLIHTQSLRKFSQNVRVRFAPSPTGFLHLGGLRTALYNYLFAKSNKGKFILRIEDTDQTRLVEGAVDQLQKDLQWAGIEIDESPDAGGSLGPYVQSQRLQIYQDHVKLLLKSGSAYHCFCTAERLELLRKEATKAREVPKYDNRCRNLTEEQVAQKLSRGASACIRFKLTPGIESFDDSVYGKISYDIAANEGDPVIVKADGYPTYHFANVVDDHCMEISHVLRGVEWQISTTKHILMYRAFNWKPPVFGHLPLLMNADGSKLSKRQGDIKIAHYRETGIFPLALLNFIVSSGGGFTKDLEPHSKLHCYSIEALTKQFNIANINSHSGKLMPDKLLEFNRLELKRRLQSETETEKLVEEVKEMVRRNFSDSPAALQLQNDHVKYILNWSVDRITKLSDLVAKDLKFIWICPSNYKVDEKLLAPLEKFTKSLNEQSLNRDSLNPFFKEFCKEHKLKFGEFMKILRSILSGLKEGPSVAEMMEVLGKETTVRRLASCFNNR